MWHMGEGSSYSSKQRATFDQDREGKFTKAKVKVKKLMTKAALTYFLYSFINYITLKFHIWHLALEVILLITVAYEKFNTTGKG